jgi:hypothetical protein
MLDTRLFDFLTYARKKLPFAKHALYTNGSKITRENYTPMAKLLDYLFIDNYSDDLQVLPHLKWLANENPDEGNCNVNFMIRRKTQILNSRCGNAPNKQNDFYFSSTCALPFMQMVVRPDGKIKLCCQDAYGDVTLGDLSCQSIREAWEGEAYQKIRRNLLTQGRGILQLCKYCDSFGLNNYFPVKWIDDYARAFIDKVWSEIEKGKIICIYAFGYGVNRTIDLLRQHGIYKIRKVTEKSPEIFDDSAFIIFNNYNWNLLEQIDPENKRTGEKYVVLQNLEPIQLKKEREMHLENLQEIFHKVFSASQFGKLAVFGAGLTAKRLVELLMLNVQYYLDNDATKQKSGFRGKPVRMPKDYSKGDLILIAAMDEAVIYNQLYELGVPEEMIISGIQLL